MYCVFYLSPPALTRTHNEMVISVLLAEVMYSRELKTHGTGLSSRPVYRHAVIMPVSVARRDTPPLLARLSLLTIARGCYHAFGVAFFHLFRGNSIYSWLLVLKGFIFSMSRTRRYCGSAPL